MLLIAKLNPNSLLMLRKKHNRLLPEEVTFTYSGLTVVLAKNLVIQIQCNFDVKIIYQKYSFLIVLHSKKIIRKPLSTFIQHKAILFKYCQSQWTKPRELFYLFTFNLSSYIVTSWSISLNASLFFVLFFCFFYATS